MRMEIGFLALILGWSFGVSSIAQATPAAVSCVSKISTLASTPSDPEFKDMARSINSYFTATTDRKTSVKLSRDNLELVPANTQTLSIRVEQTVCGAPGRPTMGTNTVGGCDYVGCQGSLGSEFSTMPVGSVVTINACGGGIQQSGTFSKAASGIWVMSAYSTIRVTHCGSS